MNVNLGIWDKLSKLIVFLLVVAGILAVAIWYLPLIHQNEQMRKAIRAVQVETQKEEERNRALKARLESLKDPKVIERLAREKLAYARPGETILRFDTPATNAPPR